MQALKLTTAYDGTGFWGSQKQVEVRTVQQELEKALVTLGNPNPKTAFAGRTDRGVHAIGQVVRCEDWVPAWTEAGIVRAMNGSLPDDIAVREVVRVPMDFHPRYDAIWREYRYRIWCGDEQPLVGRHVWQRRSPLDVDAMSRAASLLVGTHDLASFTGGGEGVPWSNRATARRGTTRRIYHCGVHEVAPWWGVTSGNGVGVEIRMIANGFLPQLVRTVVGALTTIGMNRMSTDWMRELIGFADRRKGPVTAPSHGLVLWRVGYGEDVPERDLDGAQMVGFNNALEMNG